MNVTKGMKFRAVIADANPMWIVKKLLGKDAWWCECIDEPFTINGITYPGEHAGTQKAFLSNEILTSAEWENICLKTDAEHKRFYDSLEVGSIVHYDNGFGEYVRCKVVENNLLQPIALIGNWKPYDLPKYNSDGTTHLPHYPRMIVYQKSFTPNASNIVEFQNPSLRLASVQPICLTLPDLTPEQENKARLYRIRQEAIQILQDQDNTNQEAIMAAMQLLLPETM